MTIQLKLNSDTEARLIAEARAKGVPLEEAAEQLLEQALAGRPSSQGRMSVEEFHQMLLTELAAQGVCAPLLRQKMVDHLMMQSTPTASDGQRYSHPQPCSIGHS